MGNITLNTVDGKQEVELAGTVYREAQDAGFTNVRAYMNNAYPVEAGQPSAFDQACVQTGMIVGRNREYGIAPPTLNLITEGVRMGANGSIVRDANPASRILFPAFIGAMVEDKILADLTSHVGQFNQMVAIHDVINNTKIEWPELNFAKPEAARSKAIAQLSEPTAMGTITVSDKSFKITGWSLGLEISDEAMRAGSAASLDYVALAMQRWMMVEMSERVNGHILALLNGDTDAGYGALSTVAGTVVTAQSFDAAVTVAGTLTQKAWIKFLYSKRRTIVPDWIICDMDTALAIESRTGRWTSQSDNVNSKRLDVTENVVYPSIPDNVKIFITDDASWPANTAMAFSSQWAIQKYTSTLLDYSASEAYAMRRSTKFRVDGGDAVRRLHDDAFMVLSLTVA
jgi:hypothetical protein